MSRWSWLRPWTARFFPEKRKGPTKRSHRAGGPRRRGRCRPGAELLEDRALPSAYSAAVLADSPVGYWRLGETSGTTAGDSSGNGLNGTYSGGVALNQPGALLPDDADPSAGFNGSSTFVTMGNPASLNFTGQMTLEAWIFPTAAGGILINKENQYELALQGGAGGQNTVQWAVQNVGNGGGWAWVDTGFAPRLNQWNYLAIVYDNGSVTTYGNGSPVSTTSNGSGAILARSLAFEIGARNGAGQVFSGRIDEVAAYGRALTSAQVLNHFDQACEGGLSFTAPVTTPGGSSSYNLATGDFNGDGRLDLAVADYSANQVRILLGNGDGSFNPAPGSPLASNGPNQMAVGDFNGDGRPDLAVVNWNTSTLSVFQGNGDGTFSPAGSPYALGGNGAGLGVGDFNGDGRLDIAVSVYPSGNVSVFLGDGQGAFLAPGPPFPGGAGSYTAATGDFNNDNNLDFVKSNYPNANVSVLLGDGAGGLALTPGSPVSYAGASQTLAVAVADYNNDGNQDIAVANYGSNAVSVLLNSGGGAFTQAAGSPVVTASNPYSLAAADFNGDGKTDLAVANYNGNSGYLTLLRGVGDGTFLVSLNVSAGTGITAVTAGDFNGDGAPDIAVGSYPGSAAVRVFLNQAGTRTALAASPNPTATGQPVTLTANVTATMPGAPQPGTGNVSFYDGATFLGTAPVDASGQATLTTSALAAGSHSLTSRYADSCGFFHPSTSPPVTETVIAVPADLVVDTLADENDGNFGPGDLSLREAIFLANLAPDANTITFDPALFAGGPQAIDLGIVGDTSAGDSAFAVTTPLTVQGPGAALLTLDAPGDTGDPATTMRHFLVTAAGDLRLSGLTLKDGVADGGGADGGAIENLGSLTLTDSVLSGNTATSSTAPTYGGGVDNQGTLSIDHSTLDGNRAVSTAPGFAYGYGGAIANRYNPAQNHSVTITGSTLSNNSAVVGGAIDSYGIVRIDDSTLSGNQASDKGAALENRIGARMTVTNSTLAQNTAQAKGGGIRTLGLLTVRDSTISGNTAGVDGGGISATTNYGGSATLTDTIVAGNAAPSGPDILAAAVTADFCLIGDPSGATVTGANNLNGPAQLGPLQDNGGPTRTMALLPGSPAVDAGSNALVPAGLTGDQRGPGFNRIVGGAVDLGAFEVPNQPPAADAGGPYTVAEGDPLTVNASASSDPDGDPLTFRWDLNGDGTFGDATGVNPTLTREQLEALGIADGPAGFNVRVQVSDGVNPPVTSAATTLVVTNVAPTAGVRGPGLGLPGVPQAFSFTAGDASPADQGAGFRYVIDWGDGSRQVVDGGAAVALDHVFAGSGHYLVRVVAQDRDVAAGPAAGLPVVITPAFLQDGRLNVGGTSGNDRIILRVLDRRGDVRVKVNGQVQGVFRPTQAVTALGLDGNDVIILEGRRRGLRVPVVLDGGPGRDRSLARVRAGLVLLLGGDGGDALFSLAKRSLLIGGPGRDFLGGGQRGVFYVGGSTPFDDDPPTLLAMLRADGWGVTEGWVILSRRKRDTSLLASGGQMLNLGGGDRLLLWNDAWAALPR